jgi:hypothetical protein
MWQEGMEEEERFMSATLKQTKTKVGGCDLETRGGHLTPEVKTVIEITCDYVWDKLYHHHFCNLL